MTLPRLVIYTVLTGSKEPLGDPLSELEPGGDAVDYAIDWVCFTDDPQAQSGRWQMRLLDEPLPPERSSRRPKCLPHEYLADWSHSLYIDNIVKFRRLPSAQELGLDVPGALLRAFAHLPGRRLWNEAETIVQLGYEGVPSLADQMGHYRQLGLLDAVEQLSTCTLLMRSHQHPLVRRHGQLWWEQFLLFGKRDQMSFDVAVRLAGVPLTHWPHDKHDCPWLLRTSNLHGKRVLASFDPTRYRWRYRDDPQALADPRAHYLEVGRHDGRHHGRPLEVLEWLCFRFGSALGAQVAPRRRVVAQLDAELAGLRQRQLPFLMVFVTGAPGETAFGEAECEAADTALSTYLGAGGQRLNLALDVLQAGRSELRESAGPFALVLQVGLAADELPQALQLVAPALGAQGTLLFLLRDSAGVAALAALSARAEQLLHAEVALSVGASQHDSLDAPLANSVLALRWQRHPPGHGTVPPPGPATVDPRPDPIPPLPSAAPASAFEAAGPAPHAPSPPIPAALARDPALAMPAATDKLYIAYCTSGLGNRLRPLASALAYCQATGRRLRVYWDDVTPNGCLTPWKDLFTNAIEPITLDEIAALDPARTALFTEKGPGHGVEREASRHERPQLRQLAQGGARLNPAHALDLDEAADIVLVYDNDYLHKLPRQASIDALRSLNPHPAIRAKVMATVAQLGLTPATPAVHARGTDFNLKEALATYVMLVDQRIPSGDFFLSTEDAQLEAGLRERYGARLKSRPDRLHLQLKDGKTSWSDPDSYTITREHGIDALVDIYLLASVHLSVFHPGSTFAEIARHLHGLLQGLPAPQERWPDEPGAAPAAGPAAAPAPGAGAAPEGALKAAQREFEHKVRALLPRGAGAPPLQEGPAGPVAPEQLPPSYFYWETLGFRLPLMERLFMNSYAGQPELHWDGAVFNQLLGIPHERFPLELFRKLCPYPEAWSQMAQLRGHIQGRKVLIIGSETYWLELLCARAQAAEVTTVEYRPIHWSEAPQAPLRTLTWDQYIGDLDAHAGRYDLVLTYSSIEHSGLGRYGDRLFPLGDLFTFQLMARCLKPWGLCAVAVPTGQDLTHFNAHRIYGVQRIQALEALGGLKYQGIVYPDAEYLATDPVEGLRAGWTLPALAQLPLGQYRQPVLCFAREGFSAERYRAG